MSADGAEKTVSETDEEVTTTEGKKADEKPGEDQKEADAEPKTSLLDQTTSTQSTSEWLRSNFSVALGLTTLESLLDEVSFEGIARYIRSDKCQKIVTLAGAGISTSAGIPDFRSPGTGVYDRLKEFDIPDPKRVFELDYFKEHPDIVYSLRKEIFCGNYKPTPCHYFVKLLHSKGKLLRHFTQNIDGLDLDAGIDPDAVVQAHGTCLTYHCMKCEHPYNKQHMTEVLKDDTLRVPACEQPECDGVIRPDIVFFGESLPERFGERLTDIEECDMMIILGTSLVVQPFASLTSRTKPNIPRLYINLEKTGSSNVHPLTALMFGGGFDFDNENNIRDVFWQGTCDDGCYALAELLGWGEELRTLVAQGHAAIDKKLAKPIKTSKPQAAPKFDGKSPQTQAGKVPPRLSNTTTKPNSLTNASKPNAKNCSISTKPSTPLKPKSASKSATETRPKALSKSNTSSKK